MSNSLPLFSVLLSVAAAALAVLRMPEPQHGLGEAELEKELIAMDERVQEFRANGSRMDRRIDNLRKKLDGLKNRRDSREPGRSAAAPDDKDLKGFAEAMVSVFINRVNTRFQERLDPGTHMPTVLTQIEADVAIKLKLSAAQRKDFGFILREQYAGYNLAVRRYGQAAAKVASDFRPRRISGSSRVKKLLEPEKFAKWKAGYAAWHPYLKILFQS